MSANDSSSTAFTLSRLSTRGRTSDLHALSCFGFPRTDTPYVAVKGVGVPEIVLVRVDDVTTRIRFHQEPVFTGLPEDPPARE